MEVVKLIFDEIDTVALARHKVGDLFKLWSKDDMDTINAYVQGTAGGFGMIATLLRADNPHISRALFDGKDVWLEITYFDGKKVLIDAHFGAKGDYAKASLKAREKAKHAALERD